MPLLITSIRRAAGLLRSPPARRRHVGTLTRATQGREAEWPLAGALHRVGASLTRAPGLATYELGKYGTWGIPLMFATHPLPVQLPNLWLRDNCRCRKCVNPDTMQRAFDTFSLPQDIVPNQVVTERGGLKIYWPDGNDTHVSFYPWSWIRRNALPSLAECDEEPYTLWDSSIADQEPSVSYEEVMSSDHGVGKWTAKIRKYGFCYVEGCPVAPEETKGLVERIAFIRETHYGGFYDFTSDFGMKDTAYTSLPLSLHTDTTYFTDPAGLQMFHLLSHANGTGGVSTLADGFKAAQLLRRQSPAEYEILASKPVHARAVGNYGIAIKPARPYPVLNLAKRAEDQEPELYQIRWNNDDRGIVPLNADDPGDVNLWYTAARSFNFILTLDSMQYKTQLKPGRPLIFDNWRVLHGRSSFTGMRRMCGAYLNHDDYISRWRNTNFARPAVLDATL